MKTPVRKIFSEIDIEMIRADLRAQKGLLATKTRLEQRIARIRLQLSRTYSNTAIGRRYGRHKSTIAAIKYGKTYDSRTPSGVKVP
jgi:hypothetical protein